MCISSPVPFHSDKPITAYKAMKTYDDCLESHIAGNRYVMGNTYLAGNPVHLLEVGYSDEYRMGFHAFEEMEDAKKCLGVWDYLKVVEVELSELTYKGRDIGRVVYVANQCKFVRIIED